MTSASPPSAEPKQAAPISERRLMALLLVGHTALYAVYGGVISVLLPLQVEQIDSVRKVALLGIVTGISAVFAVLFNPLGGALSDRTRSRFGRRHPWLIGGSLAVLVFLIPMGAVATIPLLVVLWCLAQAAANVFQAALTAVAPDRVARERQGRVSAITGAAHTLGLVTGIVVAGRFTDMISAGYAALGVLLVAAALLFVTLTRDPRVSGPRPESPSVRAQLAAFGSAFAVHDFRWVFIGRALMMLGYFMVTGYLLYLLQDHVELPDGLAPADGVAVLTAISAAAMVLTVSVSGPLSDRLDRRKAFVGASAAAAGLALLLPLLHPTWPTMLVWAACNGAAFGVYMAVDTALMVLVLPRQDDAGRDLGVLNIANAGPQIIAPFLASLVIHLLDGYSALFIVSAALSLAGALAILPVRSTR